MESEINIIRNELSSLDIKGYFKRFENIIKYNIDVELLTKILTDIPYQETKPYLIRRKLHPIDIKFNQIELVYSEKKQLKAIVWDFSLSLSQLIDCFGDFSMNNEPYSETTLFVFKSNDIRVEAIKTRYPKSLIRKSNFEFQIEGSNAKILNPEFKFIQWDLK